MIPTTLVERPQPGHVFAQAPMNVYWESTLACGLACRHCRAEARPEPAPGELDTAEARTLIDAVKRLGSMLIVTVKS